jgi:glycosyltransferase involved in cell wall biosynthesis
VEALRRQETDTGYEVIVVDDGSSPPVLLPEWTRVVRLDGRGPGAARNAGIAAARGAVVAFCDDDTAPEPRWIAALWAYLSANPDHLGVEGVVWSRPWDWLYASSLEVDAAGHFWTCNIAYRTATLRQVGGFSADFPFPKGEDRDLGLRVAALGPVGFCPEMRVEHVPRPVRARELVRRGRLVLSDRRLLERHPSAAPPGRVRLPLTLGIAVRAAVNAARDLAREVDWRRPRRTLRLGYVTLGSTAVAWLSLSGLLREDARRRF